MKRRQMIVEDGVVTGNVYDKYRTRNLIARRLMNGFMTSFYELVEQTNVTEVHEVGCGEGELSIALARTGKRVRGSDFSQQIIGEARQSAALAGLDEDRVCFDVRDVYSMKAETDGAPLVICCEVLEHLQDPGAAVKILSELARPYVLVSVPREPLWRLLNLLRARYIGSLGNTPGHRNWWSRKKFLRMLRPHLDIVEVRSPLPWTMVLCRTRTRF